MATSAADNVVDDMEQLRSDLEEKVTKLRKSLRTWQTWEAEYEGLKEEIQALKGKPSAAKLVWIMLVAEYHTC